MPGTDIQTPNIRPELHERVYMIEEKKLGLLSGNLQAFHAEKDMIQSTGFKNPINRELTWPSRGDSAACIQSTPWSFSRVAMVNILFSPALSLPNSLQLIFSVFKTLTDQEVTVELKNDLSITGVLKSVDQFLNIRLDNIKVLDETRHPHMARLLTSLLTLGKLTHLGLPVDHVDTQLLEDATRRVHGSLARAGKVKSQTPKVDKQEKKKVPKGRAKKRLLYNRRFVNVTTHTGKRRMNPNPEK
ncbi:hypothetical protein FISHEDRAFT_71746 [Fistulina hepatica ATCC 64428]|uniref:Sm domain-containing protein n=1 Tax=Fistulina hepatica ATCC 64428 TaxID=1128425 RepID=A0A0D7AH12_9AGAR|nr:hypothetical protein FISHEDRAFT_71746 [Fistulina hepatica ATCC 64428]